MTKKEQVIYYKQKGMANKNIAILLKMPIGTVKSIWSRKVLRDNLKGSCKNCSFIIMTTPGRKRKVFCSDHCRMKWWNSHRNHVNHKNTYRFTCKQCGTKFTSQTEKSRKYCSQACYIEARYHSGKPNVYRKPK